MVAAAMPKTWDPNVPSPEEALQRLIDGNRRFLEGAGGTRARWRRELAEERQRPFAIVLGCSDSRTPVEFLFDQGLGDLFVVRLAGNVVAPSIVGSIEFAASQFGTRLVVVLGHTRCGAISATIGAIETGYGPESKNICSITDRIAPHIEGMVRAGITSEQDRAGLEREATRANVRASADHLRNGSMLLEQLVVLGRLAVVGAEYELESGKVHFFDGVPKLAAAPSDDR
jgi:carbonic anhydrase